MADPCYTETLTLGFSKDASSPGFRFRRSEKTPSSNFFTIAAFTGLPNASKRKANARTVCGIELARCIPQATLQLRPTYISSRYLIQAIPINTGYVLAVGEEEPVKGWMRRGHEGDYIR